MKFTWPATLLHSSGFLCSKLCGPSSGHVVVVQDYFDAQFIPTIGKFISMCCRGPGSSRQSPNLSQFCGLPPKYRQCFFPHGNFLRLSDSENNVFSRGGYWCCIYRPLIFWSILSCLTRIYRRLISAREVEPPSSRSRSPIRTPPRLQLHRSAFLIAIPFVLTCEPAVRTFCWTRNVVTFFFGLCTSKNAFEWSPEHLPCIYEMKKYQANRTLVPTWHSLGALSSRFLFLLLRTKDIMMDVQHCFRRAQNVRNQGFGHYESNRFKWIMLILFGHPAKAIWQSHCISPVGSSASTLNEVGHANMDRSIKYKNLNYFAILQEDCFDGLPSLAKEMASIAQTSNQFIVKFFN